MIIAEFEGIINGSDRLWAAFQLSVKNCECKSENAIMGLIIIFCVCMYTYTCIE